jgi:Sulfotransferase family
MKEFHFLERLDAEELDEAAVAAYHRYFPRPPGLLVGEWTPYYAELPQLRHLRRLAPDARLLMIVRDPIERYRSGRRWHLHFRVDDPQSARSEAMAVERGRYASVLERVRAALPNHPLLLLQYEQCVRDPAGELARTYRFLGLDDRFRPRELTRRVNPSVGKRVALPEAERRRLLEFYRPEVERLVQLAPEIDIELWPNFARGARP